MNASSSAGNRPSPLVRAAFAAALLAAACGAPTRGEGAAPGAAERASGASLFAATADRHWDLHRHLAEISGLAATNDGRLIGHDDESAVISVLDVETGAVVRRFSVGDPAVKGDFEGIAVAASGDIYLVASDGRLLRFREGGDGATVRFDSFDTGLSSVCEVEGLAYRRASDSLILACKTNYAHAMRKTVALYAWSVRDHERTPEPWLAVPAARLAAAAGVHGFHCSSVEIDPTTGRVVLLAARERAMVELDPDGAVRAARLLGPGHPQAEGAAIMPDGALVISDEAPKGGRAQLTRYPRAHD